MNEEVFIGLSALLAGSLLAWGFRRLPGERWQFLASVPIFQEAPGRWRGLNLTWYGLLIANAQALAAAWFMFLTAAMGVSLPVITAVLASLVSVCLLGSRRLAQMVENKANTFTVGGASFLGMLLAPLLFWGANTLATLAGGQTPPLLAWCAAMTCAYALGEGLGRLACISFGCCYGKPLDQSPAWLARIFKRLNFTFTGESKKIAYADGMAGRRVIPVQALTAVVCLCAALVGTYLFLRGLHAASLLVAGLTTQIWRLISEFMRADFRGGGRLSAYQWMALAAAAWLTGLAWMLPGASGLRPSLELGAQSMWAPGPMLLIQALWLAAFLYYGRSRVTTSHLTFSVLREMI